MAIRTFQDIQRLNILRYCAKMEFNLTDSKRKKSVLTTLYMPHAHL